MAREDRTIFTVFLVVIFLMGVLGGTAAVLGRKLEAAQAENRRLKARLAKPIKATITVDGKSYLVTIGGR